MYNSENNQIYEKVTSLAAKAEAEISSVFARIDEISYKNTQKVLRSFAEHRVSESMFAASSGYGYDDRGRDTLDEIWADVMDAESAIVRHSIVNGTQAIAIGLYGLLRPGDTMLAITGKPYDTLEQVIGIAGEAGNGSLSDFGVDYMQVDMIDGQRIDYDSVGKILRDQEKNGKKIPVLEWLTMMGRTKHLAKDEYKSVVEDLQKEIDRRFYSLKEKAKNL